MAFLKLVGQIRHMLTDIIERRRSRPLDRFFFKYSLRSNLFLCGKFQQFFCRFAIFPILCSSLYFMQSELLLPESHRKKPTPH